MGFLDDLKKTAADAQRAIERQVDKMQAEPSGAPQPPPVDGEVPSGSQEPPPTTGPPERTGPPPGLPEVVTAKDSPPSSLSQPSTLPQPSNASQPLTPPAPSRTLPAGPQIRAVEETLPGSSGQANANPLPPPEPPAQ
jgi:hypothetical protein